MLDRPDVASVAALLGDRARGRMVTALMEGRALSATDLALEAEVAPSTASSHLAKLARAGLVAVDRRGRHRYVRLAGPEVAAVLEALMAVAPRTGAGAPRDEGLRRARVCYDHLAGRLAVGLLAGLRARGFVRTAAGAVTLRPAGEDWFRGLGIDVDALRKGRRPLCRGCLDWSERQLHLAGALGAALLERLLALRHVRREVGTRALALSPRGAAFLAEWQAPAARGPSSVLRR